MADTDGGDGGPPDGGPGDAGDGSAADGGPSDGATDAAPDGPRCVPEEEECNGVDDDCDGVADEGLQGLIGTPEPVTMGGSVQATEWVGVAALADGYLLGWTNDEGAGEYGVWEPESGGFASGMRLLDSGFAVAQTNVRFAVLDDGRAVAVWQDDSGGATDRIRARVLRFDGGSPGPVVTVAEGADYLAAVAPVGDAVAIVWSSSSNLSAQMYSDDLGALTDAETLGLTAPSPPRTDLVGVPADPPYALLVLTADCGSAFDACVVELDAADATLRAEPLKVDDARFEVYGTAAAVTAGADGTPRAGVVATDPMTFNGEAELVRLRPGALDDAIEIAGRAQLGPESGLEPRFAAAGGGAGWLDAVYTGGDVLHWAPVPANGDEPPPTVRFASDVDDAPVATARRSGDDAVIVFMRTDGGSRDLWIQRMGCE